MRNEKRKMRNGKWKTITAHTMTMTGIITGRDPVCF